MITLYGGRSPNVVKIVLMLEELGMPYRLEKVEVLHGSQYAPEFLAVNPLAKVPALIDPDRAPGQPIFESGAILIYLAETYGAFLPAATPERYEVLKWLIVQVADVGPMLGQCNHFMLMPSEVESYATTRYRGQAERIYRNLDARVADRPYLAGTDYSIADIATWPWTAPYVTRHGFDWADYPSLAAWCDRIADRPAVARTHAALDAMDAAAPQLAPPSEADINRFFVRETGPAVDFAFRRR